jgi:hypothetical protein
LAPTKEGMPIFMFNISSGKLITEKKLAVFVGFYLSPTKILIFSKKVINPAGGFQSWGNGRSF